MRAVGRVPPEIRLQGENEDGSGDTPLEVGAFSCEVALLGGIEIEELLYAEVAALVHAPDWDGRDDVVSSRWLIRVVYSSRAYADAQRRLMGVGRDVVDDSPSLAHRFEAVVGRTGNHVFTSPEFTLRATASEAASTLPRAYVRIWRSGTHGMGYYHVWVDDLALGAAVVELMPTPGTPLAEMRGCHAADEACAAIRASGINVVAFRGAVSFTSVRDWWNPRHAYGDGIWS